MEASLRHAFRGDQWHGSHRLMGLVAWALSGQSFEVASIKPHEGPMLRLGVSTSGQRLTADC
jgi:hypothetical protein